MTGRTRLTVATAILALTLVACGGTSDGDDDTDATGDSTTTTLLLSGVGSADDGGDVAGTATTEPAPAEPGSDATNSDTAVTTTAPRELPDADAAGLSAECLALLDFHNLDNQITNEEWERIAAKPAYEIAIRDLPDDLKPFAVTYTNIQLELLDLFALYGGYRGIGAYPEATFKMGELTLFNEPYLEASRTLWDALDVACEA